MLHLERGSSKLQVPLIHSVLVSDPSLDGAQHMNELFIKNGLAVVADVHDPFSV